MRRKTQWRPITVRNGTPRLRRENDVRADLGKMKIQNWGQMAMDREAWKRNDEHARIHRELEELFPVFTQMQDDSNLRQLLK